MSLSRFGPGVLLSVLLLAACQSDGERDNTEAAEEEETAPIPVETTQPTRGDVYAMYTGTAPIEAFAEADVIAKVDGEIRELLAELPEALAQAQGPGSGKERLRWWLT